MDINSIFDIGGVRVPNPDYTKSKKNPQPKFITVSDIDSMNDGSTSAMAGISFSTMAEGLQGQLGEVKDYKKYLDYGIYPTDKDNTESLDKQLVEAQSSFSKIYNSLSQTVVSELGLGTAKAFSDILGAIYQTIFSHNGDYSNPVSAKLEEWQEAYRNYMPIYSDPTKNIFNGGLVDVGWLASNAPSIMSSLTLLLPGAGITKGLSLAAKGLKISSLTRKGIQAGSKALSRATKSPQLYRALNRTTTVNAANRFLENGMTAVTMRGIENYQEARQVYNDTYEQISNTVNEMSDKEYEDLVNSNSKLLEDKKVNINDRNEVSKALAKASADVTFQVDWFNVGWDILQLYSLKNMWKSMKNAPGSSAAIRREQRNSMRYFGKSEEEIKELEKLRPRSQKLKEWFGDKIYGARLAIASEASEGAEEALNYIAQEEGMTFAKVLLGKEEGDKEYGVWKNIFTGFDGRIKSYVTAPQLYDSAFWGILGGVVFQGLGSKFAQVRNKLMQDKDVNKDEREESRWYQLDELPENKRRIKDIRLRRDTFNEYRDKLKKIREGIDIYRSSKNNEVKFADEVEQKAAIDRLTNEFVTKLTLNAAHNGNLDLLKEWLANDEVRKVMVENGLFVADNVANREIESKQFIENVLQRINKIEEMYDNELMALVDAATILDKHASWGNTVPMEYLQIIASDNISRRLAVESINADIVNMDERVLQLEDQFKDKLDANINHRGNVRLAVLTNMLAELRIQRRALVKDKDKSLTNQIAINDIDKRIKAIEDKLTDAELILATKYSISAHYDTAGNLLFQNDQTLDSEALIYEGALINNGSTTTSGTVGRFDSLSHLGLSERARTAIDEAIIGQYEKLQQDTDITYTKLREISPTLDGLYARIVGQEVSIDYLNKSIVATSSELETELSHLHNTMNETRKKAVKEASKIIHKIYMKHGNKVKDYIISKYNLRSDVSFEQGDMTNAEIAELQDALDVLNLTKAYNKGLFATLDNNFDLWDDIKAAQEREESQSSSTSENQPTPSPTQQPTNPPTQPTQQGTQAPTQSQSNPQAGQTNSNEFQRQQGKVRITPNIDGGFDIETNVPENEVGYHYSINGNDEIHLEWPTDSLLPSGWLSNADLYDGYNPNERSSDDRDMSATTHPILTPDANGRYQVKQKGRLVYKTATNPSTGEGDTAGTAPAPAPSPIPAKERRVITDEDDLYAPSTSTQIFSEVVKAIQKTVSANINADLDALAVSLVEEQVKLGHDRTMVQEQVNKAINTWKKVIEARKKAHNTMQSSISEVIVEQSLMTENGFASPAAVAYKNAVVNLMNQYAITFGIPTRNGKLYVNLEDLLRYCNKVQGDPDTAVMMYQTLKEYLKTDEAREKYITTDENLDSNDFLENIDKSEDTRKAERLENYVADVRVDITSIPNEQQDQAKRDEFYQAIDELDKNETLTATKVGGRVILKDSKGRVVGSLAIPRVDPDRGSLLVTVEGWKYDYVKHNDGRIDSDLKDLFVKWLQEDTPATKELNDIIYELAYSNPTAERKTQLIEAFSKNAEIVKAKKYGFIIDSNYELLAGNLVKLWRYTNNSLNSDRTIANINIESSVNLFFQKGMASATNALYVSNNPAGYSITVSSITEGQLVKATEDARNVKDYIPADKAIVGGVNPDIHKIGITSPSSRDTIITSGIGTQVYRNAANNNTTLTIPTRSGYNEYVSAVIAGINDTYISKEAKEIVKTIQNRFYNLINTYINNPSDETFTDIEQFLLSVFDNNKGNSSLLFGIIVNITGTGNNRRISLMDGRNNLVIYKRNGDHVANSINATNTKYEKNEAGYRSKVIRISDEKATKEAIADIFENARFNIKPEFIQSDNVATMPLRGLASRHNGKFTIKVGDKTWTYNSFNEFILNNNLVRLNTKPNAEGTSNYNRKSTGSQRRNQTLRVAISSKTSSPVERKQPTNPVQPAAPVARTISERVITILNSNERDKGFAIFKELIGLNDIFTEQNLNALQKLKLLPKNIIFDAKFQERTDNEGNSYETVNAEIDPVTGQVTIGPRLINMLMVDPEQAIRKLIHEQLHYHLHSHKGYIRSAQSIYDAFKRALENNIPELAGHNVEHLKGYLFDGFENRDEALEEFLVESLTSAELAEALNAIPAEVTKHGGKNLFQKFLELMSKMFNWGITKGSLYEQEFYTLREGIASAKRESTKRRKTTKENELQGTLNFDEEQSSETPVEQPTDTEIATPKEEVKPERSTARSRRDKFGGFKSSITEQTSNYTEEMQSIKVKAIADGTFMKAPNGNPTNLNERQWLQVRTKTFKNWFGDWINDKKNASKVVDENGEPLVVYHGTSEEFNIFKTDINWEWKDKQGNLQNVLNIPNSIYATSNADMATTYYENEAFLDNQLDKAIENIYEAEYKGIYDSLERDKRIKEITDYYNKRKQLLKGRNVPLFVNLRNVRIIDANNSNWNKINDNGTIKSTRDLEEENRDKDGVIIYNVFDFGGRGGYIGYKPSTVFIINKPNQIKSAISNDGSFSTTNDDIRHSSMTELSANESSITSLSERLPLEIQPQFDALVASAAIETSCR